MRTVLTDRRKAPRAIAAAVTLGAFGAFMTGWTLADQRNPDIVTIEGAP